MNEKEYLIKNSSMYCRCGEFHGLGEDRFLNELLQDKDKVFYNGFTVIDLDIIRNMLFKAGLRIGESLEDIEIIMKVK